MPQPIATQLGAFTATGSGTPRAGQVGDHTFTASLLGSGAVSATVLIEVSNDLAGGWTTLTTLTLSGTNSAAAQAAATASHAFWRATVSAMTGSSLTVAAATEQVTDASALTSSQKSRLLAVLPATESLVSAAGKMTLKRLHAFGDSLSFDTNPPTLERGVGSFPCSGVTTGAGGLNVNGVWISLYVLDGRAPSGSTGTLETDGQGRLRWQLTGDSGPGPWVYVSTGGFFELPSATAQRGLHVGVSGSYARGTATSEAITASGISSTLVGTAQCYFGILRGALGASVKCRSYGISGDTAERFLNGQWVQALAGAPDALIVLIGTNENPSSNAVAIAKADLVCAELLKLLQYTPMVPKIYVGGMFVRSDVSATVRQALAAYSARIRDFCAGYRDRLRYWDATPLQMSPTAADWTARAGVQHTDNLHLMPFGAWLSKAPLEDLIRQDFSLPGRQHSAGFLAWDLTIRAGSINPNPKFTGSGGTGSGSNGVTGGVPTSWTVTRSGANQACGLSSVARSDGMNALQVDVSGSLGTEYHQFSQTISVPAGLVAGQYVALEFEFEVLAANLLSTMQVNLISNGNSQAVYLLSNGGTRAWSNFGSGVTSGLQTHRSEPMKLLAGTTSLTINLRIGGASGGTGSVQLVRCEVVEATGVDPV